ncbi:hypothetical protein HW115_05195 [Verrucomicrobiaceae bacterium N1E253]|uniref:Lipoprotein n=1 Tax=Oceaniferula marina TaxID=2748318 RepID=A0A851GBK7_9BACT|nr:hypothetical protein [Oceaniferula marina]NWK54993.1 hypothetical protein [Oceaniferula marina]
MNINNLLSLVTSLLCALLLSQCATNRVPPLNPGEAYFKAKPEKEHRGGLSGIRIVSVNGKKVSGSAARVPSGPVKAVVAFDWPKVGKKTVPMSFHAKDGHSYFVKYDVYPDQTLSGGGFNSSFDVSKSLIGGSPEAALLLPLTAAADVTIAGVTHVNNMSGSTSLATHYIDLFVISNLSSEGVVSRVRSLPPEKVR